MKDKIKKVETVKYQDHDESRLRYIRKVETRLVEDGMFEWVGGPITETSQLESIFRVLTRNDREVAVILFLDRRNAPIGYDVWTGGIDFVAIDPRQIFKVAALLNASQLVVCHNHPEGDPRPSQGDEMWCLQISNLCEIMGWNLYDFLIVTSGGSYSFRKEKNPALTALKKSRIMME